MRQSFADWCCTPGMSEPEVEVLYRTARSAGYEAVEMAPPHRWAMAKRIGLKLLNVAGPGMQSGLNRAENHAALIAEISELIATARANEIEQIVVFTGNRAGQGDAEGVANSTAALRQLSPIAESAGVTLLLELLSQTVHPDYQADRITIGAAIARAVNSPAVKVLYDIYHTHAGGAEPAEEIVTHLDCIGHLHIAAAENRAVPRADGLIQYHELVPRVLAAGYRGWWGQEFLTSDAGRELREAHEMFERIALNRE